jgi:hypothetical protein
MLCHACNQTRHFQTVGPMWEKILEVMTDIPPPPLKQVPNMGMVYGQPFLLYLYWGRGDVASMCFILLLAQFRLVDAWFVWEEHRINDQKLL